MQAGGACLLPSRPALGLCTLTLLLSAACATADLRPADRTWAPDAEAKGRDWLAKAAAAQGGAALTEHQTVSLWLKDIWPGWFYRAVAMPWPQHEQALRLDAKVASDDARITFIGGPKAGAAWGLQQWVSYRADAAGKLSFDPVDDPDKDIKFWLPTTLYFPFIAWRIQEADVVRLMTPERIGDRDYHRVFVSWGQAEPQEEVDQYIIYIDGETHLIRWARYTVRDFADFAVGLMRFEDYREVDGVKLPFSMRVVPDYESSETGLHRYVVERVQFDAVLPEAHLLPRPDLAAKK